jgi:hypothetical protein
MKLNPGLLWQKGHSTRKKIFITKLDLILRKALVKCYTLSRALYVWCWNFDISPSRSEIPGKFRNVVLEKD